MTGDAMEPTVRERPVLFSAPMVRAIHGGLKSQTRRIYKPRRTAPWEIIDEDFAGKPWPFWQDEAGQYHELACRYGKPGDRLWVRETWGFDSTVRVDFRPLLGRHDMSGRDLLEAVRYGATAEEGAVPRWRPSIHMPRWASRITLEVTDVRVERLQSISEEDAIAEGVTATKDDQDSWKVLCKDGRCYDCFVEPTLDDSEVHAYVKNAPLAFLNRTAVENYSRLWDVINGAGAWALNPWVWAVSFRRIG